MDKRLIRFLKKDKYLRKALESGQDVYSAFAAKLFNCDYSECLEFDIDTNEPKPAGQYRRKVAKFILCSMYFSTKRRWHMYAFNMINELPVFLNRFIKNELTQKEKES